MKQRHKRIREGLSYLTVLIFALALVVSAAARGQEGAAVSGEGAGSLDELKDQLDAIQSELRIQKGLIQDIWNYIDDEVGLAERKPSSPSLEVYLNLQDEGIGERMAYSPVDNTVALIYGDYSIRFYDVEQQKFTQKLRGHSSDVRSVAFSSDGKLLLSGSWDGTVLLWDLATGKSTALIENNGWPIDQVGFSPDSQWWFWETSGKRGKDKEWMEPDMSLEVLSLETGERVLGGKPGRGDFQPVAFSPLSNRLAYVINRKIRLVDLARGEEIEEFLHPAHQAGPLSVALSPDGETMAVGYAPYDIQLWDLNTREELVLLKGHTNWVVALEFSRDGKYLVSGAGDGSVRLWYVITGEEVAHHKIRRGCTYFYSVGISPDGELIAATRGENLIVWKAPWATTVDHRPVRSAASQDDPTVVASKRIEIAIDNPDGETGWLEEYVVHLEPTGDIDEEFGFNWYRPHGVVKLSTDQPEGVTRVPDFKHAIQRYVILELGNGDNNQIAGLMDFEDPGDEKWFSFDLYLDRDRDGDLAEDYIEDDDYIAGIQLFYGDGTTEPYALNYYAYKREEDYAGCYYRRSGRYGVFEGGGKRIQVLVVDESGNGRFDDEEDIILLDWDLDGRLDGSHQADGEKLLRDRLELDEVAYRVSEMDAAGRRLVLRRDGYLDYPTALEGYKSTGDQEAFDKAAAEFVATLPKNAQALNKMVWKWVNEEQRFYEAGVLAARKAADLSPEDGSILDTLAYAELGAGQINDAIEHFRQAIEKGYKQSEPRLATALAKRGQPADMDEAARLLLTYLEFGVEDRYVLEALKALGEDPKIEDPDLKKEFTTQRVIEPKNWEELPWHHDLPSALEASGKVNKPVFVDFSTTWCGWCRRLEKDTYSHPRIWEALKERLVLCHLDGDKAPEVVKKYEVSGYPTLAILNAQGEILLKKSGYRNPKRFWDDFLEPLDSLLADTQGGNAEAVPGEEIPSEQ